jgi:hypothetical protein
MPKSNAIPGSTPNRRLTGESVVASMGLEMVCADTSSEGDGRKNVEADQRGQCEADADSDEIDVNAASSVTGVIEVGHDDS